MHHEAVFAFYINIRCNIEWESCISIHVMSEAMPVEPHRGTMIYTIEGDAEMTIPNWCGQHEVLDIYALSAGEITGRASHLRVERQFDAPVVGHWHIAELLIAISRLRLGGCYLTCRHLSLFGFGVIRHLVFLNFCSGFSKSHVTDTEFGKHSLHLCMILAKAECPVAVECHSLATLLGCRHHRKHTHHYKSCQ